MYFQNQPKIPHQYLFWQPIDEFGNELPNIILSNGNLVVEIIDKIEDYDEE